MIHSARLETPRTRGWMAAGRALALTLIVGVLTASLAAAEDTKGFDPVKARRLRFHLEESPDAGPVFDRLYGMYKKAGRLAELVSDYEAAVKAEPGSAAKAFILGRLQEREREWRAAEKIYAQGLEAATGTRLERFFLLRRGVVLSNLRRYEDAIKVFIAAEKAARDPDQRARVLEELGRAFARSGRRAEAARTWKRILLIRPRDFFATTHVATLLASERLYDEVEAVFTEAIKGPFASDPAAVLKLRARQGEILAAVGRTEAAAAAWREVLRRTRKGNWLRKQVKARLRKMYYELGRAYDLVDFFKELVKDRPEDEEPVLDLADAYEVMGARGLARRLLLDKRDAFPGSIVLRERLLHLLGGPQLYTRQTSIVPLAKGDDGGEDGGLAPGEEETLRLSPQAKERALAKKKAGAGAPDKSLLTSFEELLFDPRPWAETRRAVLAELIRLAPAERKYYRALVTEQLRAGLKDEAKATLTRLRGLSSGIDGLLAAARALHDAEELDRALELLKEAAEKAPGDERPWTLRGDWLLEQRRTSAALAAFARAAGSAGGRVSELDPFGLRTLSTLLEERKMLLPAARALARAVEADGELAIRDDLLRVGKLYRRAERLLDAGRWFLRAFEVSTLRRDREMALTLLRESLTEKPQLTWLQAMFRQRVPDPKSASPEIVVALADVLTDLERQEEAITLLEEAAGGPPSLGFATARAVTGLAPKEEEPKPLEGDLPPADSDEEGEQGPAEPRRVTFLRALVPLYSADRGGKPDVLKAFAALRELAIIDPKRRWTYALAEGVAQLKRAKRDDALQVFRQILDHAPAQADVFERLARRFGELDKPELALRAARRAVEQKPRDARRHWTVIELVRREPAGLERTAQLIDAYRRFVRSGVNKAELETAREDLYRLLIRECESLARRGELEEAVSRAREARTLAGDDKARARAQLLAALLQLDGEEPVAAIEVLQGAIGRYAKGWVVIGRTGVRVPVLAAARLRRLEGEALKAYSATLASRGQELLALAKARKDRDLLQRLSRLFPREDLARSQTLERCLELVESGRPATALRQLEALAETRPAGPAKDPLEARRLALETRCRQELGELGTPSLDRIARQSVLTLNPREPEESERAAPVLYGTRLFYFDDRDVLHAVDLRTLPKGPVQARGPDRGGAHYELGARTARSRVLFDFTSRGSYYYRPGSMGVASLPRSIKRKTRAARPRPGEIWRKTLGDATVMVARGGRLFVAGNGVQALDPRSGRALWRFADSRDRDEGGSGDRPNAKPRAGSSSASPQVRALDMIHAFGRIYAMLSTGEVVSLDPRTGEELWSSPGHGSWGSGTLETASDGDRRRLLVARADLLTALDARHGKRLWVAERATVAAARARQARAKRDAEKEDASADEEVNEPSMNSRPGQGSGTNLIIPKNNPLVNLQAPAAPSRRRGSTTAESGPATELVLSDGHVLLSNRRGSYAVYRLRDGATVSARFVEDDSGFTLVGKTLVLVSESTVIFHDITSGDEREVKLPGNATGGPVCLGDELILPVGEQMVTVGLKSARVLFVEQVGGLSELSETPDSGSGSKSTAKSSSRQVRTTRIVSSRGVIIRQSSSRSSGRSTGGFVLDKVAGKLAIHGDVFTLVDPETGKRVFEVGAGASSSGAGSSRPWLTLSSQAFCVMDRSGRLRVFRAHP